MKMMIYKYTWLVFILLIIPASEAGAQDLRDYLEIAADENAGLKGAYAEFEAAMQEAPQVKSLPDPTLTMSAFGRMVETRLGPQEARFSLMQMFPWFGTLSAREDVAVLRAEAKFQAYMNRRNELFFQVSEQFYELFELEQKLEYQRRNLRILEDYRELALAGVRAGNGALADVLQVDLMRNETQTTTAILEKQRKPLVAEMNALLNRPKSAEVQIPDSLEVEDVSINQFRRDLFPEHPGIVEMEKMRQASEAQETAARKAGLPSIGLGVDYVIIGERTDMNPEGNGQDAIMPMLSVSLPIFRKKHRAAQEEARLMQESYNQRQVEIRNSLEAELESSLFEAERYLELIGLYKRQIETSDQVANLLVSSYRNAESNFEEVLRVRQELLRFQLEIATAKAGYFTELARIKYITGNNYQDE